MLCGGRCVPIVPASVLGACGSEGHTAHATREEAEAEAQKMLHVYGDSPRSIWLSRQSGVKSANERFAGARYHHRRFDADERHCNGTSHFSGTEFFAKAFNVQFVDKNNKLIMLGYFLGSIYPFDGAD